jgi:hypothetical protein
MSEIIGMRTERISQTEIVLDKKYKHGIANLVLDTSSKGLS